MARIRPQERHDLAAPPPTAQPRLPIFQAIAVYFLAASVGFLAVVGAFAGGSAALGTTSMASDAARLANIAPAAGPAAGPTSRR